MRFVAVANERQQLETILDDLLDPAQAFDPARSRVLIFVRTRRKAEETTQALKTMAEERNLPWAGQVDFFHAGLDGIDRGDKYEAYKPAKSHKAGQPIRKADDETVVLVATKAFGMGMDIGNIHYLYHLGPSSTFEDFLQEVGRAGRDEAMRQRAGFVTGRPIRAMCVATRDAFDKLRGLQHSGDLSWGYLGRAQEMVHRYVARFRPVEARPTEAFPLPLDLAAEDHGEDGSAEASTKFRLALHWLEQLKRIRLGMYTPASLPILLLETPNYSRLELTERREVEKFVARLRASPHREGEELLLPVSELLTLSGKRRWPELTRLLYRAQRARALRIERDLTLTITELRRAELTAWRDQKNCATGRLPLVEAVFGMARQMLGPIRPGQQRSVDGNAWDELAREIADEHYQPRSLYWQELDRNKRELNAVDARQKLVNDWQKKRAKFALKLVRLLPHTRVQTELNRRDTSKPRVVQLIYNGEPKASQWQPVLAELQARLYKMLAHVVKADQSKFNYAELVIALGLEDAPNDTLGNLLFLARALGYLRGSGSLVPMGIELFLHDVSPPDRSDQASEDYQVSLEFEEGLRLKVLRLMALQCLANLKDPTRQDGFIKRYFQCDGSGALLKLLEEFLPENHPSLAAFQKEALVKAEQELSDEQQLVYNAPVTSNLQVLAGPGAGKTKTLTLRVARLIESNIAKPEEILVLAYNRAVVVELKDRLSTLFRALGYGRLIQGLHVHTFHSLCKRCLRGALDNHEFDEWVPLLAQALDRTPGLLDRELGRIRYVFVDEFQDITALRLRLLQRLAPPNAGSDGIRLCVIGDPNQSIYGYERQKEGGDIDPYPYYLQFHQLYQPQTLYLSNNYRSYPHIIETAAGMLAANTVRFKKLPSLKALRQPSHDRPYCEVFDCREKSVDWKAKLQEMLGEEYEHGKPYQQVAVMLRSNDEVLRAFNALRHETSQPGRALPPDVELRIQGISTSPLVSREFNHLFQALRVNPTAVLRPGYIERFKARKEQALAEFGHVWDHYLIHLAHCLLVEFNGAHDGEEATHQELLDFIQDLARKDDGHFAKLYEKHIATIVPGQRRREVVFTTMHKVKGLEFDAVLLPPSFATFGLNKSTGEPDANLAELVEEERRLLYVAYTRARYRLIVLNYEREYAVAAGCSYILDDNEQKKVGRVVEPGIDKLFISWGGRSQRAYDFIRNQVKIGEPVEVVREGSRWLIYYQGTVVGQLRGGQLKPEPESDRLLGLAVAGVACYTLEESRAYDIKHNKSFTDDNWQVPAVTRGHIYLIDFAGYYKQP
jgi:ATP-dependent DNA helicase RecQ